MFSNAHTPPHSLHELFHLRAEISFFGWVQSSFQQSLGTEELILVMVRGDTNLYFYRIPGKLACWARKVQLLIFAAQKPIFIFLSFIDLLYRSLQKNLVYVMKQTQVDIRKTDIQCFCELLIYSFYKLLIWSYLKKKMLLLKMVSIDDSTSKRAGQLKTRLASVGQKCLQQRKPSTWPLDVLFFNCENHPLERIPLHSFLWE